jgi:hypothetical protein
LVSSLSRKSRPLVLRGKEGKEDEVSVEVKEGDDGKQWRVKRKTHSMILSASAAAKAAKSSRACEGSEKERVSFDVKKKKKRQMKKTRLLVRLRLAVLRAVIGVRLLRLEGGGT